MTQELLIKAALDFPWHLRAYERWLDQRSPGNDDYLYSEQRVRLRPCDEDQLTVANGLSVEQTGNLASVRVPGQPRPLPIPSGTRRELEALLTTLRSHPTVIELPFASGVSSEICDQTLEIGFGRFIFAPESLTQLETSASGAEIVRFPGSPYEIVRNYWLNVGCLNRAIELSYGASVASDSFVRWLRGLHVQLLLGSDLKTFYCPSSPVTMRRVEPGALFDVAARTLSTPHGEFILDGPRINASPLGGPQYNLLLDRSLGIGSSEHSPSSFVISGTSWGRLVKARGRAESQDREWYLPPRPLSDEHWNELFMAWKAAAGATSALEAVQHLAKFHWCFVHLHPFSCANQSLAFALVNWVLKRFTTSGIPHLVMDQLALRHDCARYVRLFARAVDNWTNADAEPAARHMNRVHKRQLLDSFIAKLATTQRASDADAIAQQDPHSARLALLLEK